MPALDFFKKKRLGQSKLNFQDQRNVEFVRKKEMKKEKKSGIDPIK